MDHFELHSEYKPTGDQPQAIEKLVKGFKGGVFCFLLRLLPARSICAFF